MFKFNILKENHTGIDITWLIHVNNIVFVSYQIKNSLHELCFHKVVQWPLEIKKKSWVIFLIQIDDKWQEQTVNYLKKL